AWSGFRRVSARRVRHQRIEFLLKPPQPCVNRSQLSNRNQSLKRVGPRLNARFASGHPPQFSQGGNRVDFCSLVPFFRASHLSLLSIKKQTPSDAESLRNPWQLS